MKRLRKHWRVYYSVRKREEDSDGERECKDRYMSFLSNEDDSFTKVAEICEKLIQLQPIPSEWEFRKIIKLELESEVAELIEVPDSLPKDIEGEPSRQLNDENTL